MYGKLFGKSPPFEQIKMSLLAKWNSIGEIYISDLPNGFLLVRYPTEKAMQQLLLDGPWSVNEIILQLSPWKPFFELSFAKLNSAAIWVQFHNLPVECWDGDVLETIASNFDNLIKVDEFTSILARSNYARVCIEIDLSKLLCRGFWIGDDFQKVFVIVMYERLLTFCYNCGLICHGSKSCTRPASSGAGGFSLPSRDDRVPVERTSQVSHDADQLMDTSDPIFVPSPEDNLESDFGPWLLVSRRRGRARCHGGGVMRAPHVTPRTTAGVEAKITESRGTVSHSSHSGSTFACRGPSSTFHASHDSLHSNVVETLNVQNPIANLAVNQNFVINETIRDNPLDPIQSPSLDPQTTTLTDPSSQNNILTSPRDHPPPNPPNQIVPFHSSRGVSQQPPHLDLALDPSLPLPS
ncbi:uncharacterized protein LOC120270802 [Dioscorea cayenensis subsp. rotundata]|uniref:Uncharacterized protein LOC120270802 n=1 Tax=Dioscorea cayennensis subsp. rotundata TaxID=55577 RepID=A0AB40C5H9_DIOCR|nr:uncharacterized protein LOC120270802 [Dioscorea cayenensis subsp. rotundata]